MAGCGAAAVVKLPTRKSRAGAGATRTSCTDCTPSAVGPPLSVKLTSVGNGGDGGGNCVSVKTGSHCTAGTVMTKTDWLWLTRYIDSTANGETPAAVSPLWLRGSHPTPN